MTAQSAFVVAKTPELVRQLGEAQGRGPKSNFSNQVFARLKTLKDNSESVQISEEDFRKLYGTGSTRVNYFKQSIRAKGIEPVVAFNDGKMYIWKRFKAKAHTK